MKRFSENILGLIGIFASVALGIAAAMQILMLGPRIFPLIQNPLALVVGVSVQLLAGANDDNVLQLAYWLYLMLHALAVGLFAFAFWRRTSDAVKRPAGNAGAMLALQMLIGLCVQSELLNVVAAELGYVLLRRNAVKWLVAQVLAFFVLRMLSFLDVGIWFQPLDLVADAIDIGVSMVWMVVAFGVGYLAASEKRGRIERGLAHAEILATQQMLMDSLRASERLRISRNVHDAIGHHLTALNLHLELGLRQLENKGSAQVNTGAHLPATELATERATESFRISRALAQGLLAEIRSVVSVERDDQSICLRQALDILCSGIPVPRIALSYDETLDLVDPMLAHAIFRGVQEAVTNAVKHARADAVDVTLLRQHDGVSVTVSDNGTGVRKLAEGNGLAGMRDRVEALRGSLELKNGVSGGFRVQLWLPIPGGAA
ncbi:MAG: ATP-binding protein [Pseudomonadota bacterium]